MSYTVTSACKEIREEYDKRKKIWEQKEKEGKQIFNFFDPKITLYGVPKDMAAKIFEACSDILNNFTTFRAPQLGQYCTTFNFSHLEKNADVS